ncbi:hypothetical protein EZS27_044136, partial [termite gut metagenome]
FWDDTENAVRIQVYSAIIAYCLVAIVQNDLKLSRSTYEVLQILSISLTDKTPLLDLFNLTASASPPAPLRKRGGRIAL